MERLPATVSAYKRTPQFDESSVPKGLLRNHSTKAGVWGQIVVASGTLIYRIFEPEHEEHQLGPGCEGVISPESPHEVELCGPVSFHVQFFR